MTAAPERIKNRVRVCSALAAVAALGGCGSGNPAKLAESYIAQYGNGKYSAQYAKLSPAAKKAERRDAFVDYQSRQVLNRTLVKFELVEAPPSKVATPWRAFFKLVWKNSAGREEITWQGVTLVRSGGGWYVQDTPAMRENAREAYLAGEYSKATRMLQDILRLNPTDAESLDLLGYVYRDNPALRSNLELAVEAHRDALRLEPKNPDWHNSLGNDYRLLGWFTGAVDELKKAIAIAPRANYYVWLGVAYGSASRVDEANAAWRQALKLEPDNAQAHAFLEKIK